MIARLRDLLKKFRAYCTLADQYERLSPKEREHYTNILGGKNDNVRKDDRGDGSGDG